jgi:signal transduction histidine kinase
MNAFNSASLINLLGFSVGIALYALLLIMVLRQPRAKQNSSIDLLLLATAALGILWNMGELSVFILSDFGAGDGSPVLTALAYSALGFLPSVVVHSAWRNSESAKGKIFAYTAYALSAFAALLHFREAVFFNSAPSSLALKTLTISSLVILAGLLIFNFKQTLEKKMVWATALLIFAVSTLHLSSHTEGTSWLVELVAHQSSLPLALVILYQDYRFAFADLFLKRALSLILLTLTAFGLYVFVASPLLRFHESHDRNDVQAISLIIILWVATALIYPLLHKFAVWLVDKILLRRANYELLRIEIAREVGEKDSVEAVLNSIHEKLSSALTANTVDWAEVYENQTDGKLPFVTFAPHTAQIYVPTTEAPFYKITLKDFYGGRHLLSDEITMLEAVALLAARQIDALRVTHERCEQEIREQEFSKLATEAQLSALRAQINPHFLFNALTTIGYLIQTAPDKAFSTLMRLTQLLRGVLHSTGEFSTLGDEIKLIESYLEIEKARFEERLEVDIKVSPELYSLKIPALILQPLVENAIKHGISNKKDGGKIKISAAIKKEHLILQVFDTGAGLNKTNLLVNRQKGVGLNNVENRLQSYFGSSAKFTIESETESGTNAKIIMPISLSKTIQAELALKD